MTKVVLLIFFVSVFTYSLLFKSKGGGANEIEPKEEVISLSANISYPSQILDLVNWKITLPIGPTEIPIEIKQPELANFMVDPWFRVTSGAVRFRAPVNGKTTKGSSYPRSELREMADGGKEKASWSSEDGTHIMSLDLAITSVPMVKQDVVVGQIHDDNKDVIVIRLDYPHLHVRVNGKDVHTLDSQYVLGKRFAFKFVVEDNHTEVYFNQGPNPIYTLNKKYSNAYFKAGVYTQSNCDKEGSQSLCNEKNYGEVIIYQIGVIHQ